MLANAKRVYALANFTVELRQRGWFYWPTYGEKGEAKGPYTSMASVTRRMMASMGSLSSAS